MTNKVRKEPQVSKKLEESNSSQKKVKRMNLVQFYLMIYDVGAASLAYFLGLWLQYDFIYSSIPSTYLRTYARVMPWYVLFVLVAFSSLHLYRCVWRFASFNEMHKLFIGSFITSVFHYVVTRYFIAQMPLAYYFIGAIIQLFFTVSIRFAYRFILLVQRNHKSITDSYPVHQAMIVGGGAAGQILIRELLYSNETRVKPCCIIDDDPNKWGHYIEDVPIAGGRDDILACVEKYKIDQILIAIPTASSVEKRDIINVCKETTCELKILPGMYQLVNGEVAFNKMKEVAVEDLLGRDPIKVNMDEIYDSIRGKVILVTGGGGSIGSELCRQIASKGPKQLIIFDIYENNAYDIEQELRRKYPNLNLLVLIGSVRDCRRIDWVFETYKPEIVYHAAAHKHVPLMETSPCEAIKNNVIGTYKTAYAALNNDCKRFVLISTDKAVNPTNIMGASKRLCEMVIQSMDAIRKKNENMRLPKVSVNQMDQKKKKTCTTEFVAVRFGNVLGSNGSVVPLFRRQIESGGPVTVTHPDIIRYFMTIPEAVSLVLQAGTYAKGGEIFVLDMGAPVKIDTLARNLIKLSGHKPDEDIKVVYTGLRPGEKLYEEKLMEEEGMKTTPNHLIHIGKPIPFDTDYFLEELQHLADCCYKDTNETIELVHEMVPTFHSSESDLKKHGDVYKELYSEAVKKNANMQVGVAMT